MAGPSAVNAAVTLLPEVEIIADTHLGIDERRYRSVRFFRNTAGGWTRSEPCMTRLVDLGTGQVLGVVDGRTAKGEGAWRDRKSTRLNSSHWE